MKGTIFIVLGSLKNMGGAERQALYLAEGLSKRGADVKILSFGGGDLELYLKEIGIPCVVFSFNFLAPFREKIIPLIRLTILLRKYKPLAFIPFITINSKYIGLIWKYTGAKFACWNQRDEGREVFGTRLEKYSIRNVPVVISNSYTGKQVLISKLGISSDKVKIINNGVIINEIKEISSNVWRKELNINPDVYIVTMIASIYKYKDHKTLLFAWDRVVKQLRSINKKAVLVLAGKDKGIADSLKILAFDLRIADSIYFVGAINNVNQLIIDSDLIVHSSNTEGCPNGVLEAMASKKAVIGTDIPGIRQALGLEYHDFCLNEPENSLDMANKIVKLLIEESLRREIEDHNYFRVQKEFSMEDMVTQYTNILGRYVYA